MATERLPMRKIREILRLKWVAQRSHREAARSLGVSVGAVASVVGRAKTCGLTWAQLEALSDVGEVVSSSLVLDEVLQNIIMNAVRFSGCDGGSIMEYVEEERCFSVRSAYASSDELLRRLRGIRVELETTLVGRAAREGHPIAVADLDAVELDPHLRLLHDDGWRSVLAVPVLRGARIIGALVVRRKRPGDFSEETIEFLETFASQSIPIWMFAAPSRRPGILRSRPRGAPVPTKTASKFPASTARRLPTRSP